MSTDITRRTWLVGASAAALGGFAGCISPAKPRPSGPSALRLIGEANLPHRHPFKGTPVGGLSGLDFDPTTGLWVALSDDRSDLAPARCYTLRLDITPDRLAAPELVDLITLQQPKGLPYPSRRQGGEVVDPEAIRFLPGSGNLLWTSEGDRRLLLDPFLRETDRRGRHVRSLSLPRHLQMSAAPDTGPRDNLTLEGLALTPDGQHAWVAMEAALLQDGPVPTVGAVGGPCRFTRIELSSGRADLQRAYVPNALPRAPLVPGTFADNGVSEVLMLDAHRMLVLERAYAMGVGNSLRLYEVDTREASNTLDADPLAPGSYQPLRKRLLADFAHLGLSRLDNTEGMAWGPTLPNGRRTLVFVSDDNFNPLQVTQFVACEFTDTAA